MRKVLMTGCVAGLIACGISVAWAGGISGRYEVKYVGTWSIQPNGDVNVVRTFTVPAMMYTDWKQNNMHMKEMRNFNPAISTIKVDDLDFKWDDVKRTLTLTMVVRGLIVNKGDYWEGEMSPGLAFSNIDAGQKKAYFHATLVSPDVTVTGQDIVVFPEKATDIQNIGSSALRYKLPEDTASAGGGGTTVLWWALFGVALVAGIVLIGASSVARPTE